MSKHGYGVCTECGTRQMRVFAVPSGKLLCDSCFNIWVQSDPDPSELAFDQWWDSEYPGIDTKDAYWAMAKKMGCEGWQASRAKILCLSMVMIFQIVAVFATWGDTVSPIIVGSTIFGAFTFGINFSAYLKEGKK